MYNCPHNWFVDSSEIIKNVLPDSPCSRIHFHSAVSACMASCSRVLIFALGNGIAHFNTSKASLPIIATVQWQCRAKSLIVYFCNGK